MAECVAFTYKDAGDRLSGSKPTRYGLIIAPKTM